MKQFVFDNRIYLVNQNGAIYRQTGKELSQHDRNGYRYVEINENGHRKKVSVHRIVASCFLPNPNNLPCVNHIDGDPHNNDVSNLEWVTQSENQTHSRYVLHNVTGFADTPVMCMETGKIYRSTRDAWRDTKVGYSHISECVKGKRKTAGGYHWESVRG